MQLAKSPFPTASETTTFLGRYRIVRELGRGAQGRVYLANDTHLEREVAIKTLASGNDPKYNADLIAEARTIGQLAHPNIVTLYDAFEDQGMHCIVLEYVEGKTLERILQSEGRIAAQRATHIAAQILDGLKFAHARGIVHRDIKPANILIDTAGNARIMDFGIAAAAGQAQEPSASGSPRYMAPEILGNREVARNADVFSVGMSLYEMLTGRAVVEGRNVFEVLHKIANEPYVSPSALFPEIDEGLDQIVMRALAKDPAARYGDAAEMRLALEHYLRPTDALSSRQDDAHSGNSAIEFLLNRMRHKSSFPALSQTISSINRITASEAQSVQALTEVLLKDFSLTNKLLRLVNSSGYGQFGGTISTVSRAVHILGFDAVRNLAMTVVLFEHLQNKGQADKLRDDVIASLFTGIIARRVARVTAARDAEEGFICGVFYNLGHLLAAYYLYEESIEIARQMQQSSLTEAQAAKNVLGVTYAEIGVAVARSWRLPQTIVRSIERITDPRPGKPRDAYERLQLSATLADALAGAASAGSGAERDKRIGELADRFGAALPLDERALAKLASESVEELLDDTAALLGDSRKSRYCQGLAQTRGDAPAAAADGEDTLDHLIDETKRVSANCGALQDSCEPAQVLTAGIQDITNTLVGDFNISDLLRIILETMYRAMGFSRVLLFMRDQRAAAMIARLGYGADIDRIIRDTKWPLGKNQDVFSVVLEKNVDVLVTDVDAARIRTRIPEWFRKSALGQTFVVLPVVVDGKPIGLIYGEKPNAGDLVITLPEMSLLKTLRNQAVLALKQRR
jgi:serine/threonine protein kinase